MDAYPQLFSPIKLGKSLTLRNRIVFSPHTTVFAAPGGYLTQREADYQAARAKGGIALTVLGTNVVHPSSTLDHGVLANLDDSYIPGYRLVADAVHQYDTALFVQLNHQGAVAERRNTSPLQAPSAIPSYIHHEIPHAMDVELIHDIARAFGAAAERCQRGGVDGVLVHAAHGFLLNQFLSPLTNQRTDEYGGSAENRMRFLFEVLTAIRNAVGENYPVGVRLNVHEYLPGGITLTESLPIAERLDSSGLIDYLDVSCGVDYDWMSEARHYPGMHFPAMTWVELAAEIKKHIRIPVSCAGRIRSPAEAEDLLASGKLDLAQMARALIADPDMPNKARTNRTDEIRQCMYISSGCLGRLQRGLPISCVQNPTVGRERTYSEITPAPSPRRVIIVGGGPAGMQAAITARQRGHTVTLFERETRLGGQMQIAANAPGRAELLFGVRYLENELQRLGVDVRLGIQADLTRILSANPDVAILATGSTAAPFPADTNSFSVRDVLQGKAQLGAQVVVLDGMGRIAAASSADYLASRGHQVTIVTHGYAVGEKIDDTTRPAIEASLRQGQVRVITGTDIVSVTGRTVHLRDAFTMREWTIEADTLVYDLGGRARDELYDALRTQVPVYRIGDCLAPRGLEEAYQEGFDVAYSL